MAQSDTLYQEIAAEVDAVLDELGTSYSVRGAEAYDTDTLKRERGPSRTVVGLVADQKTAHSLGLIPFWKDSKSLILKASSNPKPEEEVLVDDKWYSLFSATPIRPADVTVVYMLELT